MEAGGLDKPPKKQDLYPGNPLVKGRRGEEAAAGPGAETEWVAMRSAKGAGANRRRVVL